ncbi:IS110 family transposase [Bradyrhizobium cajani]|uniref:IS110 family transposase n=1 Tax=Bradyrhizobium cajani TaxID=1928661 RepID=UPI00359C48FA
MPDRNGSLCRSTPPGSQAREIRPSSTALASTVCEAIPKGHKNDFRDAEAIAEAAQRPTMRFVPLKSAEQLDLQALHRSSQSIGDAKNRGHQSNPRLFA